MGTTFACITDHTNALSMLIKAGTVADFGADGPPVDTAAYWIQYEQPADYSGFEPRLVPIVYREFDLLDEETAIYARKEQLGKLFVLGGNTRGDFYGPDIDTVPDGWWCTVLSGQSTGIEIHLTGNVDKDVTIQSTLSTLGHWVKITKYSANGGNRWWVTGYAPAA